MSVEYIEKRQLNQYVKRRVKPARIIVDIGCGINPQKVIKPKVHICVEPYIEYIKRLAESNPYEDYVFMQTSGEAALNQFPDKSIDSIFMIDVIEHLEKEAGINLLKQCDRVAKRQIIIFTPLGFFPQVFIENRKDLWGMDGGSFQEHKSGWEIDDFDDTWDLLVVKEYHFDDGYGNIFDKTYGAIFAVKNFRASKEEPSRIGFLVFSLKKMIPSFIRIFFVKIKQRIKRIVK
jgi:hypothetical protein